MTGPQQPPYGGQGGESWPGGGGDWQSPSDQTQYGGPPGGAPGGPPGGSYEQPQGYDQYGQPQSYNQYEQPAGYPDQYSAPPNYQDPYSAPPAPGYGDPNAAMQPPPPPQQKNSALPWILGGVGAVVVLILVAAIGAVMILGGDDESGGTTGPGGGGTDDGGGGKYTVANVTNACDLVDPSGLEKWAKNQDGEPEHQESKRDYSSRLSCYAKYKGSDSDYANMRMSAYVGGESDNSDDTYARYEKSAKGNTGTGRESGDISGLGEKAFYATWVNESEYSSSAIVEVTVLDDNLVVRVYITAFSGDPDTVDKDDVRKVCEENAQKVMDGLKA